MNFGIRTWAFYHAGLGKDIPSLEAWDIFAARPLKLNLDFAHHSFGSLPAAELVFLLSLAQTLRCRRVFEFGTCTGVTAYNLALNCPGEIFTLDLGKQETPRMALDRSETDYVGVSKEQHYWRGKPEDTRIHALTGDSALFDTAPYAKTMDLVFVDGSHAFHYVLNDSEKAFDLLSTQGAILWHDYMPAWSGVVRALNQLSRQHPLYHIKGTSLVLYLSPAIEPQFICKPK